MSVATDILERIDINTGTPVNYKEVTLWYDGTTMSDAKADGVIYKKKDSKYYRRQFDGPLNIKWFGAKGDGVTDDTVAIQKAIDFCPLNPNDGDIHSPKGFANGYHIYIPTGRYKITSTLSLKRGIRIEGSSRESCQLLSFVNGSVLKYEDNGRYIQDEIVVKNISIWQDSSVVPSVGAGIEVTFGPATVLSTSLIVENIIIEGTYNGITLGAGIWSSIKNVNCTKCINNGFEIIFQIGAVATSTTSTTFLNCYSSLNGKSGFKITRGGYCSFIGCASDTNTEYGYHIVNGLAHSFEACGAEENTISNMYLDTCEGIKVNANLIYGISTGVKNGCTIKDCKQTIFVGGRIAATTATGYGINISSNIVSGKITIIGTDFYGNYETSRYNTGNYVLDLSSKNIKASNSKYTIGGYNNVKNNTLFSFGGNMEADIFTALESFPIFTEAGPTRNVVNWLQASTADTAKSYPLIATAYIAAVTKGTASTIQRYAGQIIVESSVGSTANANMVIDSGSLGTVPAGNWNIYSNSSRDSVFNGSFRFVNSAGPIIGFNAGNPEGVKSAPIGSICINTTATNESNAVYIKISGTGNIGWQPVVVASSSTKKYTQTFGDGVATTYTITHNLNTEDITYKVWNLTTNKEEIVDIEITSANTVQITTSVAPDVNELKIVII